MAQPYTDADVELVANTLWVALGFSSNPPTDACYDDARKVLAALVDAGWQKARPAYDHGTKQVNRPRKASAHCTCESAMVPGFPCRPWCATEHQHPGPDCVGLCEPGEEPSRD